MNKQPTLFSLPKHIIEPDPQTNYGKPRLVTACRNQYEMRHNTLDDLLPKSHLARDIWSYVENLNLSRSLRKIKSTEGSVGRPATDPKILLCLWLFAIIKGIGSSRVIEEYCNEHDAFKWICGGVNVNHHTISDFRSNHGLQLNDLLTSSVAALAKAQFISLEKVSQDGIRVRASAGSSSFSREPKVNDQLELAKFLVEDIEREEKKNPGACKTRLAAAEKKAAEDRVKRLQTASETYEIIRNEKIETAKEQRHKVTEKELKEVRVSKTDPEARIMKMACSGYRPAYNIQFASCNVGKAIVGVEVTNKGDTKQTLQMIKQVEQRYEIVPEKWFIDGGYNNLKELNAVATQYNRCKIYMPVKEAKNKEDTHKKKPKDSEAVGEWRERMGTEDAKELYKERAETAEFVNAQARNRGLQQLLVRGIEKVKCVALLYALTHNMMLMLGRDGFDLLQIIKNQL